VGVFLELGAKVEAVAESSPTLQEYSPYKGLDH